MTAPRPLPPALCERCALEGRSTLADYVFRPEEETLQGPLLGDPDCWPARAPGWDALCEDHYRRLAADASLDYAPAGGAPDPRL